MPVPKDKIGVGRFAPALRRLGVSKEALAAAPQITPILKNADGGLKKVRAAMRLAQDEVITAFLRKYDAIPACDREHLPIEAIALAAGVDIHHLLGSIMLALQMHEVNVVKMIAMSNHHKIIRARVKYGQLPFGERDRTALDTAMGFLPSPAKGGATFINKAIFGSGTNVMNAQGAGNGDDDEIADDGSPDLDKLFPPANLMQEKLTPIRQRLLPQG